MTHNFVCHPVVLSDFPGQGPSIVSAKPGFG